MTKDLLFSSFYQRVLDINDTLKKCDVAPSSVPAVVLTDHFMDAEQIAKTEHRHFFLSGHQLRGIDCRQTHPKLSGVFDLVAVGSKMEGKLSREDQENIVYNAEMGAQSVFVLPNDLACKFYLFGSLSPAIRDLALMKVQQDRNQITEIVTNSLRSTIWDLQQIETALRRVSGFEYGQENDRAHNDYRDLFMKEVIPEDCPNQQLTL